MSETAIPEYTEGKVAAAPAYTVAGESGSRLVYPHNDETSDLKDGVTHFYRKTRRGVQVAAKTWKPLDWAAFFIPAVGWLRTYTFGTLIVRRRPLVLFVHYSLMKGYWEQINIKNVLLY